MNDLYGKLRAFLSSRKGAYVATFSSPMGKKVLEDLSKFCREHDSTFHADARLHAVLEGRREVLLRIRKHLHCDEEQLWNHYARKDIE